MSISINYEPSPLEHIYNPFYYSVDSTNRTKLNFKYIFDVYCSDALNNGNTNNTIYAGRYKASPDYVTGFGVFSPARVLENYVYNYCDPFITASTLTNYSQLNILIKYGEEYDSSPSITGATGTTIYSGLTSSGEVHAINSTRQYNELHSLLASHDIKLGTNNYYLTDWNPSNIKTIRRNEYEVLSLYTSTGIFQNMLVTTFDSQMNQLGYYYLPASAHKKCRFDLPAGTANLDFVSYNQITSTGTLIMDTGVTFYNIVVWSGSSTVGKTYHYEIDDTCTRYNAKRLCWLNRWGGYDYFTFTLIDRQYIDIVRNEWTKTLAKPDYNIGDLSRTVLYINGQKHFILTSDWVNDEESALIQNLFTSPEIYLIDNGNKLPVILTDKTIEQGTRLNNQITNYTLNFDYGWTMNLQRS